MSKRHIFKVISGMAIAAMLFMAIPANVFADTTGEVTVDSAKVRTDASTNASTVTTLAKGTSITITESVTGNDGNTWYHVSLSDGKSGYVRSDLVQADEGTVAEEPTESEGVVIDEGEPVNESGSSNAAGVDLGSIAIPDGVSAMDYQMAEISVAAGKIRSDASTNDSIVVTLAEGDSLVIAGSKDGSDGKTWYYVAFLDGGSQKTGFIRSDLVKVGEVIPMDTPEEVTEEESPAEEEYVAPVNNDYELVYTDDGTGNNVWYLYNHIDNTREKLQELLDFADHQEKVREENEAALKLYRMLLIIVGALLVLAIVALVVVIIRSRNDGYDYDDDDEDYDEDDDDEEEEEERAPSRRLGSRAPGNRRRVDYEEEEEDEDEEEEEVPASRPMKNAAQRRAAQGNAPRRPVSYDEADDAPAVAPKPKKKPKNFVIDDDDFEFEFLNMNNK